MNAVAWPTTFSLPTFSLAQPRGLSPSTYGERVPIPKTAQECDRLLSALELMRFQPRITELTKFLGASSAAWTQTHRDRLATLIASAGPSAISPVLDEVVRLPRAEIIDDAERVLRLPAVPAVELYPYVSFGRGVIVDDARVVVIRALGNRREREAIPVLARALDEPADEIRDAAALALGRLGIAARVALQRRDRVEKNEIVRASIADALDEIAAA